MFSYIIHGNTLETGPHLNKTELIKEILLKYNYDEKSISSLLTQIDEIESQLKELFDNNNSQDYLTLVDEIIKYEKNNSLLMNKHNGKSLSFELIKIIEKMNTNSNNNKADFQKYYGSEIYDREKDIVITERWFIEKYCLGELYLKNTYSKYAMGMSTYSKKNDNDHKITYNEADLINEIEKFDGYVSEKQIRTLVEAMESEFSVLFGQFRNQVIQKLKLKYLLFSFTRNFNILYLKSLFDHKSMENVPVSMYTDINNKNGDLFHYLQLELQKEDVMQENSMYSIRKDIIKFINLMEERYFILFIHDDYYNMERMFHFCNKFLNFSYSKLNDQKKMLTDNILNYFYLKLIEYEFICQKTGEQNVIKKTEEYCEKRKHLLNFDRFSIEEEDTIINNIEDFKDFFTKYKKIICPLLNIGERAYRTRINEFIEKRFDWYCKIHKEIAGSDLKPPFSAYFIIAILYETLPRNEDNNVRGKGFKKEYGYYLGTDDPNTINARLNLCSIDYKEGNSSLLIKRQYETVNRVQITRFILEDRIDDYKALSKLMGLIYNNIIQILNLDDINSINYICNYFLTTLDMYSPPDIHSILFDGFCNYLQNSFDLRVRLVINSIGRFLFSKVNFFQIADSMLKVLSPSMLKTTTTKEIIFNEKSDYFDIYNTFVFSFTLTPNETNEEIIITFDKAELVCNEISILKQFNIKYNSIDFNYEPKTNTDM